MMFEVRQPIVLSMSFKNASAAVLSFSSRIQEPPDSDQYISQHV
jgi:hypothetical protein